MGTACDRPELSRLSRFRSARIFARALAAQVAILFQRIVDDLFQLFRQRGFNLTGATGARFRMLSKITADVSPLKAILPVAIW